jgi:hypothetical protein
MMNAVRSQVPLLSAFFPRACYEIMMRTAVMMPHLPKSEHSHPLNKLISMD